jgi:hypothetical protein
MDYLRRVIRDILTENVTQSEIVDATNKKYEVIINYEPDNNGNGGGERLIQPCVYGRSTAGNYVLRAYQPYGDSSSKSSGWKEFRVDKIKNWDPQKDRTFQQPPGFNTAGDNGMSDIYVMSDFGGTKGEIETAAPNTSKDNREQEIRDRINKSIDNMKFDYIKKNTNDWQNTKPNTPLKGNQSSINDMSRVNNFDTGNEQQTVGPVKKGNEGNEVDKRNTEKIDYTNALKNGPRFKGSEKNITNNNTQVDNNEVDTEEIDNEEKENG